MSYLSITTPPSLHSYKIIKQIGSGATAVVYLAKNLLTNVLCAIKCIWINSESISLVSKIKREIEIMNRFDNIFIMRIYDIIEDETSISLVMEYAENGSLYEKLNNNHLKPLTETFVSVIFAELMLALEECARKGVIHRDIKLENVLFDRNNMVRLSDFGLACIRDDPSINLKGTACGSPLYCSPEIITRDAYSTKTDIWSLGVVMFFMLTGKFPFYSDNIQVLFNKILHEEPEYPDFLSYDARDLISHLLDKNPEQRYNIQEAFGHPWVARCFPYQNEIKRSRKLLDIQAMKFPIQIKMTSQLIGMPEDDISELIAKGKINEQTGVYKMLRDSYFLEFMYKLFGNNFENKEKMIGYEYNSTAIQDQSKILSKHIQKQFYPAKCILSATRRRSRPKSFSDNKKTFL